MKILLSWLREFVPFDKEPRELATDLSLLGFAVDAITSDGNETVFEIDVTTNRPDALSHYGLAREVAARYGLPFPSLATPAGEPNKARPRARRKDAMVEIVAADLCGRYSARLIRGVEVKPSPEWLVRRLELVGVRSINNVADATNYVLMAYGHPMHAFDLDRLQGGRIIVRRAASGEQFTTLDSVCRTLTSNDLVIADAGRAVALAGGMGGLDTEISPATKNVLLESAWFDPVAVRSVCCRRPHDLAPKEQVCLLIPGKPDALIRAAQVRLLQFQDQIAGALGVTGERIRKRKSRALGRLRALMGAGHETALPATERT